MMSVAPIVLFVYNRPQHTLQTLEALSRNQFAEQSELFIFCDGPKADASETALEKIRQTRDVIRTKQWCGKVHITEANKNLGLANSVISGVTKIVNEYGRVIVLEDDIITAPSFLTYMNRALDLYQKEENVMQVTGYYFPIEKNTKDNKAFFIKFISSWGWGTWRRAWEYFDTDATGYEALKTDKKLANEFDLNGSFPYTEMILHQMEDKSIDSWAIRWLWSVFKRDGITLFPDQSLIENIGYGEESTHTKEGSKYSISTFDLTYSIKNFPDEAEADVHFTQLTQEYLLSTRGTGEGRTSKFSNILKRIKHVFSK